MINSRTRLRFVFNTFDVDLNFVFLTLIPQPGSIISILKRKLMYYFDMFNLRLIFVLFRFVLGYIKNPFALEDEWQAINEETNVMNLEIFNEGEPNNNEGKHFCVGVDEKKHYSYDCHEMHSLVCEVFISTQTLGFWKAKTIASLLPIFHSPRPKISYFCYVICKQKKCI